jgi:hypothetical protein
MGMALRSPDALAVESAKLATAADEVKVMIMQKFSI